MAKLYDHQFANVTDYDCFSQAYFRDVDDFVRMKADPFFQKYVKPDHEKFADTKRSQMTIGWVEEFVTDGVSIHPKVEISGVEEEGSTVGNGTSVENSVKVA
ncbi:MAG: hypothetical protein M1827_006414 [Pycnora praestabilis]|nr:MAG: hypothetical protein M1827_006414 [Pycnora praestabilis]